MHIITFFLNLQYVRIHIQKLHLLFYGRYPPFLSKQPPVLPETNNRCAFTECIARRIVHTAQIF